MNENIEHLLELKDSRLHMSEAQQEKLKNYTVAEETGLIALYRYIEYRKLIQDALSEEQRRELERDIRLAMSELNPAQSEWQELQRLHHCSVTADQARLADAAFLAV